MEYSGAPIFFALEIGRALNAGICIDEHARVAEESRRKHRNRDEWRITPADHGHVIG
jgi:hypothetical protein